MLNKFLNGLRSVYKKENGLRLTHEEVIKIIGELSKGIEELEAIIFFGKERMEKAEYEKKTRDLLEKISLAVSVLKKNNLLSELVEKIEQKFQLISQRAEMYVQEIIVF
ncbi:MAG: hypothetical protein Athens101410_564 [Parcubacteria group bacterium Athens1014_10]|nr:MAG: hypothetical protein Athens101410_564 [Parcubacteria group bacterium Athens1014_10]TSD04667.1 MAG: hypothetical protein Athens071412_700 [Parcubacteria group bacterium Athens0714_12]